MADAFEEFLFQKQDLAKALCPTDADTLVFEFLQLFEIWNRVAAKLKDTAAIIHTHRRLSASPRTIVRAIL